MKHVHSFCRFFIAGDSNDPATYKKHWNPTIRLGDLGSWYIGWECSRCGAPGYRKANVTRLSDRNSS